MPETIGRREPDRRLPHRRPRRRRAAGQPPRRRPPPRPAHRGRHPVRRSVGRPPKGIKASFVDVDNRQGAQSRGRPPDRQRPARRRDDRRPHGHGRRRRPRSRATATPSPTPASPSTRALEITGDFTQEGGAAGDGPAARGPTRHRRGVRRVRPHGGRRAGRPRRQSAAGSRPDVAVVGFDDSPVATTTMPAAHQRPPADRGDGPRDGPPACRCRRGLRIPCHGA